MRPLLIVTPPIERYSTLYELDLRKCSACRKISHRLYLARHASASAFDQAESARAVLRPHLRARTYSALVTLLAASAPPPLAGSEPWSLRFESHTTGGALREQPREHDLLCGVARYMPGPPAVQTCSDAALEVVLVRTRRLWYLCSVQHRSVDHDRLARMWAARPYSFSAATDVMLARLVVSLALHYRQDAGAAASAVLDPCCGSGGILFAAALRGVRSVGCDLNPLAVRGARANLAYASSALGLETNAAVLEHDCTARLPEAARALDIGTHVDRCGGPAQLHSRPALNHTVPSPSRRHRRGFAAMGT